MIFAYCRVSTRKQASGNDVQMQRAAIERWALGQGVTIPPECWFVDSGVSGKFMDRPAWDAMQAKLVRGATVVVYDLFRAARNLLGLLQWVQRMKALGVRVVFLKESIDLSTPMGDLLLGVLGAFGQWQAEMNATKAKEGMAAGKAAGARYGRAIQIPDEKIREAIALHGQGKTWAEAAQAVGMHRNGLAKRVRRASTMPPAASDPGRTADTSEATRAVPVPT